MSSTSSIPRPTPYGQTQSPPIIYLIRHGEKNAPGQGPLKGLSIAGHKRANALPAVFNADGTNPYNIRFMLVMRPKANDNGERPWQTVLPLAVSLQQTILQDPDKDFFLINDTIPRDDVDAAAQQIVEFINEGNTGNILVCWEHKHLNNILKSFKFKKAPQYPSMFDVVWTLKPTPVPGQADTYSWGQLEWSSERTEDDVALADNGPAWMEQAGISSLTTQSADSGSQYVWVQPSSSGSDSE